MNSTERSIDRRGFLGAAIAGTLFVATAETAQAADAPPRAANPFYAMDTSFQRPGLNLDQQLDLVKELGFAGIAWHEEPAEKLRQTLAACDKRGLKMYTIYFGANIDEPGEITWSTEVPKLIEALDGRETILWLHIRARGPAFDSLKEDSRPVKKLRALAESAAAHKLRVAIYPHFGEWTARVSDAVRLAKLVNHPRFGVTFNLCHTLATGDEKQIPQLLEEAKPVLSTVTICGADSGVRGGDWSRLIRPLGQGTYDAGIVMRALRKIEFTGPIGFQGYAIRGDARSILVPTMAAWKKLAEDKP